MNIAIIPARGGSKRIPKKNIKEFMGKPIISYSIAAAIESNLFDEIIVSTDDEDIANIAINYGASVPFIRPNEISDDYTGTNSVVKHAIKWFELQGKKFDYACCIYATAPFVKSKYIVDGFNKLSVSQKSFAFSVTSFPYPIQRGLRITKDGSIDSIYPEMSDKRSQDLEEAYHDAGQFYWGKSDAFLEDHILFSEKSLPIILPRVEVQDIDTMDDWHTAEAMYRGMNL